MPVLEHASPARANGQSSPAKGHAVVGRESSSLPALMGDSVEALLGGLSGVGRQSSSATERRSGPQTPLMRQLRVAEAADNSGLQARSSPIGKPPSPLLPPWAGETARPRSVSNEHRRDSGGDGGLAPPKMGAPAVLSPSAPPPQSIQNPSTPHVSRETRGDASAGTEGLRGAQGEKEDRSMNGSVSDPGNQTVPRQASEIESGALAGSLVLGERRVLAPEDSAAAGNAQADSYNGDLGDKIDPVTSVARVTASGTWRSGSSGASGASMHGPGAANEFGPEEFVRTEWTYPGTLCHAAHDCTHFPNAGIPAGNSEESRGRPVSEAATPNHLITGVSRVMMEQGPRIWQQDMAIVEALAGQTPIAIICDGHGTIPLRTATPQLAAIGGKEAAEISANVVLQYCRKYASQFSLWSADRFFHDAFVYAHRVVIEQIMMGSERLDGSVVPGVSSVDHSFISQRREAVKKNQRFADGEVVRKVVREFPQNGNKPMAYYQRAGGGWDHLDFGATCTVCMVMKAPSETKPFRKVIITANAGDSDVCLFRFATQGGNQLMTTEWLTKEHSLYNVQERSRRIRGGVLSDAEGRDHVAHRVCVNVTLPNGVKSTVAYEPTRGLGHAMGQYYGIIPGPSVSVTEAAAEDVILVASDGLWNVLGQRRPPGDMAQDEKGLTGELLSTMRLFMAAHRHKDAQAIANEVMVLAMSKGLKDNTSLVVFKMDSVATRAY